MNLFKRFRRSTPDPEIARRQLLLRQGRITDGMITDIGLDAENRTIAVYFSYELAGVDYSSSQTLDDEQQQRAAEYSPGTVVTVRFDPRHPANSIVV